MGITLRKQDVQQKALVNANSEEPMKVRVIPARKKFLPVAQQESVKKRVAAYCRVSSESDEQELSFESQFIKTRSIRNRAMILSIFMPMKGLQEQAQKKEKTS